MLQFLDRCDAGHLVLGEDAEQQVEFFSVTINLNYSAVVEPDQHQLRDRRFGLGVCSQGLGLKPHLLLLPERNLLLLGFNAELVGFSIRDLELQFSLSFSRSPFASFVLMYRLGLILVFHEIGVAAITDHGREVWRYEKDVIVKTSITREQLNLEFMNSAPVSINIRSGLIETSSNQPG